MIRLSIIILSLLISFTYFYRVESLEQKKSFESDFFKEVNQINVSNSIKMYEAIEKYSKKYKVPKYIAYNVAYKETRYKGPFHRNYNHVQKSYASALGPMQIMLATAKAPVYSDGMKITPEILMNDIDLNVQISMKILRRNFEKTGSWKLACGKYNTGRAIVNDYAVYCSTNKNYKNKWIR